MTQKIGGKLEIFEGLIKYHISHNLHKCRNDIVEGVNSSVEEGDENERYKGVLILANGKTLIKTLLKKGLTEEKYIDRNSTTPINSEEGLFNYINLQKAKDGAHIHDGYNKAAFRVKKINNNVQLKKDVYNLIPENFLSHNKEISVDEIGTKTLLALELPQFYPKLRAYQIKRSGYNILGIGKVTYFDKNGLVKEFCFEYAPNYTGQFIDEERKIIGILKTYKKGNKDKPKTEQIVYLKEGELAYAKREKAKKILSFKVSTPSIIIDVTEKKLVLA